jgi:hypothetical protein
MPNNLLRAFKWAYDPEKDELIVWKVSGPEAWATPQHGDKLTKEEYNTFYQGRAVFGPTGVESFTFYNDRPFVGRTPEGITKAQEAIDEWFSDI